MMNLVHGSSFSSLMAFLCFTVMSEFSLDELGFKAPGALTPVPPSSDSSVEAPSDGRPKCFACPRRMSKKMADRHTLCVNCRGFDYDIDTCCEEYLEWPEEEVRLYAKYRKSLKSKDSSKSKPSAPPPPADSKPSSQPSMRGNIQSQVDSLNVTVISLAESLSARLDALTASLISSQSTQSLTLVNLNLVKLLAHAVRSRLWVFPTGLLWFPPMLVIPLVRVIGLWRQSS